MSNFSHLRELQRKHEDLSRRVEELQKSPSVDDLQIGDMKKQKLILKEEITRLEAG